MKGSEAVRQKRKKRGVSVTNNKNNNNDVLSFTTVQGRVKVEDKKKDLPITQLIVAGVKS